MTETEIKISLSINEALVNLLKLFVAAGAEQETGERLRRLDDAMHALKLWPGNGVPDVELVDSNETDSVAIRLTRQNCEKLLALLEQAIGNIATVGCDRDCTETDIAMTRQEISAVQAMIDTIKAGMQQ